MRRSLPALVLSLRGSGGGLCSTLPVRAIPEVILLAAGLVGLEALGRRARDDAADVLGLGALASLALLLALFARAGAAPLSRAVVRRAGRALGGAWRRLSPAAGVAFRLPTTHEVRPDRLRTWEAAILLVFAAGIFLAGSLWLDLLGWVKRHVAYAPYLVLLAVIWALFAFVVHQGLQAGRRLALESATLARVGHGALVLPTVLVTWLAVVGLLAWSRPEVSVGLALGATLLGAWRLTRDPGGTLALWRRDRRGRISALRAVGHLRASYAVLAGFVLSIAALAAGPRLDRVAPLAGPFALTQTLGLAATAAALLLLVYVGRAAGRQLDPPGGAPDRPLRPTLWWPGSPETPAWLTEAEGRGWQVVREARSPHGGFDLVAGVVGSDPRCFDLPPAHLSEKDALFRLERRGHVVKRRGFRRGFRRLLRDLARPSDRPGRGHLFAPHIWAMPQVISDTETGGVGSVDLGGHPVGRPYAALFAPRVRRYIGMAFRALDVDLVYWRQGVRRGDLERVFGVMFETWDQGRGPLREHHFTGLPRIRAILQEPEDVDALLAPGPGTRPAPGPLPLRARILVVRRDGPGAPEDVPARAPGRRRPEPTPVLV